MKHTAERASQVPKDAIPGGVSYGRPGFASQDEIMPLKEIFELAGQVAQALRGIMKYPLVSRLRALPVKIMSSMKPNP